MTVRALGATSIADRLAALRKHGSHTARKKAPARADARTPPDRDGLGSRVLQARRTAGLTRTELARRVDLSLWMIDRLEHDQEDATPHLRAIAGATGRPVSWFVSTPVAEPTPDAEAQPAPEAPEAPPAPATPDADTPARSDRLPTVLVLAALTLLLVIRAFTELIPILPRAANFVDIPILLTLLATALVRPTSGSRTNAVTPAFIVAFLFVVMFAVATMTNLSRVEPAPALMFLYGFIGPVGVYYAVHRLWVPGTALRLSRALVAIGVLQLLIAFGVQFPQYLSSKDPDVIAGTFGENAYQLVFFMLVLIGLLAGIFTFEKRRLAAKFVPVLVMASLVVIFLAQYRSLLVTTALAIALLSAVVGTARGRGALIALLATAGLVLTLAYVVQNVPELKFGSALQQSSGDPTFYLKKRWQTASVVGTLFTDQPRFALTGTGPGTYSSRGWQTFALAAVSRSNSNVAGSYVKALTNGRLYTTDVSDKYVVPQLSGEVVDGSRALSSPFSSYLSLLAEVGVIGFTLIVMLYLWAFAFSLRMTVAAVRRAQEGDPLPALLCASTIAFFVLLQMALLENWFEVTRLTFLTWIIFAVVTKEFGAREEARAPDGRTPSRVMAEGARFR